jgi:hypothetical protein
MERIEQTEEKSGLVGPRAHERENRIELDDVRLADGRPLYHALLTNPETLVLSPDEAREAQQKLLQMFTANPDEVLTCQGKTLEEARAILESIEE